MKFRRIELKNFRQFYGEQNISFSTSITKNITLIHAENGTGKTALLNAILWCFYGIHTSNFQDPKNLLNKIAREKKENSYRVSIEFEDDKGNIYFITRGYYHLGSGNVFQVYEIVNGSHGPKIENPDTFINSIIPKDMAKYFFFQGEGIGKISDSNGSSVVKTAVREILGFTIAESALKDIQIIKREYQKSFSEADKTGVSSKLQKEIIALEDRIQRCESDLNGFVKSITLFNEKIESIETKLANSDSAVIKQLHNQRKSAESQLVRENSLLANAHREKRALVSEFATTVFGFKLSNLALDFIDESEYKGTVPAPYNEQLVKDILESTKCICGAEVKPNTDAFNCIQNMMKQASDPILESRIRKSRGQLIFIKNDAGRAKKRFKSNMTMLADSEAGTIRLKKEIGDLEIQLKGVESLDNIDGYEQERKRCKNNLIQDERSSERARISIENDEKLLILKKGELNRLGAFSSEMNKLKELVTFSEQVESILRSTLEVAEKDVEKRVIEKVNKYLEKFVRQDYRARLETSTFEIRLIDKNNHVVPESDGQALLLSLTFIASLIELSRERKSAQGQILTPGAIAPFVVDAPFGDLDNKYKGHVAHAIPNSVEQVVFLLSSSHWQGDVERNIRDRVGEEYNMVLEETSNAGIKTQDSIKILGKEYDTVRYGCAVDRTVLEKVGTYA